MPKCIASCSDPNPSGPECSGAIVADDSDEGCECEKDFLMSSDKCVPKEDCGCVDPVGNYVEASFHVLLTSKFRYRNIFYRDYKMFYEM